MNTDVSSPKCSEGDPNEEGWDPGSPGTSDPGSPGTFPGSPGTSGLNGNGNYDEDMEVIGPLTLFLISNVSKLKLKNPSSMTKLIQ